MKQKNIKENQSSILDEQPQCNSHIPMNTKNINKYKNIINDYPRTQKNKGVINH